MASEPALWFQPALTVVTVSVMIKYSLEEEVEREPMLLNTWDSHLRESSSEF